MAILKYRVFHAVVEAGSLTKAAETLNMTQSGVSHVLSGLESEMGFSLLIRGRSGVSLTSNGERMLKCIRDTLRSEDRLREEVAAIKGLERGQVRIGTFTSVSAQWLPGMIKEFQLCHPALDIRLAEGDYDEIGRWIINGSVDFGFLSLPAPPSLETIPLVKDEMLCILPMGHPLQDQRKISFEQIKEEFFIMPKWGSDDDLRRILHENNVSPKIKYEVTEDQAIIAMVKNGLGISILPAMVLFGNDHGIRALKLEKPACRTIGVACPSLKKASPAARKFLDCVPVWLKNKKLLTV
ncbi:MAG TPA: LysR family transcriptional regulator [Patescibacteria group bacterium]|nr:LysR family transcriptional regulator [Patescibacteria group bacterium]